MSRKRPPATAAARVPDDSCGPDEHPERSGRGRVVSEDAYARAAALFRVAGDIARLKLLDRLGEGEWCVTELAEAAGVGLSTVSQQLRILRGEHLVVRRRSGKHTYYSLADRHVTELIANVLEHASEERAGASTPDDDD
jgi:DNA-binding transcriptional ArsR family regulator